MTDRYRDATIGKSRARRRRHCQFRLRGCLIRSVKRMCMYVFACVRVCVCLSRRGPRRVVRRFSLVTGLYSERMVFFFFFFSADR